MTRISFFMLLSFAGVFLNAPASARETPSFQGISFDVPVLKEGLLISPFGLREDPFRERPSWHGGIDIHADWDARIHAPTTGEVVHAGPQRGYGKMIDLKVSGGWVLRFAHLSDLTVEVGDQVLAGQVLGEIGSTGRAIGPHLHLEALFDEKQYDPVLLTELELYETELDRN